MRRMFLIPTLALLSIGVPSFGHAADLRLKAPAQFVEPITYTGFFYGISTGTERVRIGNTAIIAPATPTENVYAAGGLVAVSAGYIKALGPASWGAVEVSYARANTDANVACAPGVVCGVERNQSLDLTVMYGGPSRVLSGLIGSSPVQFGPASDMVGPAPNDTVHPFLLVGARYGQAVNSIAAIAVPGLVAIEEKHDRLHWKAGVGVMVQMSRDTVWMSTVDWTGGSGNSTVAPGGALGGVFGPKDGATIRAMTGFRYSFKGLAGV